MRNQQIVQKKEKKEEKGEILQAEENIPGFFVFDHFRALIYNKSMLKDRINEIKDGVLEEM